MLIVLTAALLNLSLASANANVLNPGDTVTTSNGCKISIDTDGAIIIEPPGNALLGPHGPNNGKDYLVLRVPVIKKCSASLDTRDLQEVKKTLLAAYGKSSVTGQDALRKAISKINNQLEKPAADEKIQPASEALSEG